MEALVTSNFHCQAFVGYFHILPVLCAWQSTELRFFPFFLKQTELRIILLHNTGPLCFRLTLYVCCYRKLSNMVNPLMDLSDLQMKFWKLVSLWSSIGNFRQVQSKVIIHIYLLCLTPVYKVVILYSVSKLGLGVEIVMCRFVLGSVYAYGEYWSRFEIMPFD